MTQRTYWHAPDLGIVDEPLAASLLKYRQKKNRQKVIFDGQANLVSSITTDGKQMPILDMDFPHRLVESSTPGHTHLYIDVPMSRLQWTLLMWALYNANVIELGFFVWSIRRGGNFVRAEGIKKNSVTENTKATHGWFFKLKEPNG